MQCSNGYGLVEWQRCNIEHLRRTPFIRSQIQNVTAVAYYFRPPTDFDNHFWRTEFAFLKTYETQGWIPSILVVNACTPKIKSFCEKYSIKIQIAENLISGKIETLALDLVENLNKRFDTDYVLIIQNDGFPMRPGLSDFVGRYDYIGAPWVHHTTYYDLYPYKYCVGNGGFSLRSKRLCEIASRVYRKWFKYVPYWWYILGDDTFYCKTLRFWFRGAVKEMKWPTLEEASRFSIEGNDEFIPSVMPLGFHAEGFLKFLNYMEITNE